MFLLIDNAGGPRRLLKGFGDWRTFFRVQRFFLMIPRVLAALEPRAGVSERFQRYPRCEL